MDKYDRGVQVHVQVDGEQLQEYLSVDADIIDTEAKSSGLVGISTAFAKHFDWQGTSCAKVTAMVDGIQVLDSYISCPYQDGEHLTMLWDTFQIFDRRRGPTGGVHRPKQISFVDPPRQKIADGTNQLDYTLTERKELGKIIVDITRSKHVRHSRPNAQIESSLGCTRAGTNISKDILADHRPDMVACLVDTRTDPLQPVDRCSCKPVSKSEPIRFKFAYHSRTELGLSVTPERSPRPHLQDHDNLSFQNVLPSNPLLLESGRNSPLMGFTRGASPTYSLASDWYRSSPIDYTPSEDDEKSPGMNVTPQGSPPFSPASPPLYSSPNLNLNDSGKTHVSPTNSLAGHLNRSSPIRRSGSSPQDDYRNIQGQSRPQPTVSNKPPSERRRMNAGQPNSPARVNRKSPSPLSKSPLPTQNHDSEYEVNKDDKSQDSRKTPSPLPQSELRDQNQNNDEEVSDYHEGQDDISEDSAYESDMFQRSRPPRVQNKEDLHKHKFSLKWREIQIREQERSANAIREKRIDKANIRMHREITLLRDDTADLTSTHGELLNLAKLTLKRKRGAQKLDGAETSDDGSSSDDNDVDSHERPDGRTGNDGEQSKPTSKKAKIAKVDKGKQRQQEQPGNADEEAEMREQIADLPQRRARPAERPRTPIRGGGWARSSRGKHGGGGRNRGQGSSHVRQ